MTLRLTKRDYFLQAVTAGCDKKREWVNQVFSQVLEYPGFDHAFDYGYRLYVEEGEFRFTDPANLSEYGVITDAKPDTPLCRFDEPLVIKAGDIANYKGSGPLTTTYGRFFVNHLCLVYPFGDAFEYVNGFFNIKAIEDQLYVMLMDDPEDESQPPPPGKVYVRQYLVFCDHVLSLVAYNNLAVTSVTRKALVAHPKARAIREQLEQEYKDQLSDPAVVAKIGDTLQKLDMEWLAGDEMEKYYAGREGKLLGAVRKKMFYLFGGESPFEDGTSVEYISKSLEEGIDVEHLPTMINSLRYGSYNRGAQTQLGGESTKTIYRMMGTVRIAEEDCGSKLGIPLDVNSKNKNKFLGLSVVQGGKSVLLTRENIDQYVGTRPALRGPLTCKTAGRSVCAVCIGKTLAEQPEGLAAAAAEVGGIFLKAMLARFHARALSTEKWDIKQRLS